MDNTIKLFTFLAAVFSSNFIFAQPPCSDYNNWNSSSIYHSGNRVNYDGKVYRNRYDWNSSGEAPSNCVCCSKWCMGGHQWYDEGGCTPAPLPIELISFKATKIGESVLLTWKTLLEINNDYFLLFKSSDGNNWTEISKINGSGNTLTSKNYSEIDLRGCDDLCYYRLVQVDFDGTSETFDDIVFYSEDNEGCSFCMEISPNPIKDNSLINFTISKSGDVKLQIYSEWGQLIFSTSEFVGKGDNQIELNFSMLSQGIYILRLLDSWGNSQIVRLVKN